MSKSALIMLATALLFSCIGCTQPPASQPPHEMDYQEIMSLPKYSIEEHLIDEHGTRRIYLDYELIQGILDMPDNDDTYAYVEAECVNTQFYALWYEDFQSLSIQVRHDIKILTLAEHSDDFRCFNGYYLTVSPTGKAFLSLNPSYYGLEFDEGKEVEIREVYHAYLEHLGATIDEETGYVSLPSGWYEFTPMSDMTSLVILNDGTDESPLYGFMQEGETYTMFLHDNGSQTIHAYGIYPTATDNLLEQNNHFGFSQESIEQAKEIAFIVDVTKNP